MAHCKESTYQCRRGGIQFARSPRGRNSNPLQYTCMGNSMDRGDWQGTVHGVAKSWTQLSDWACMLHYETSRTTIGKGGSTPQHTFSQWPLTPMAMLISPKWYHKLQASGRQGGSGSWRRWWELSRRAEPHSGNRGTWEIRGGGALEIVCEQVVLRAN